MINKPRWIAVAGLALPALLVAGCTSPSPTSTSDSEISGKLTVLYDSNYRDALETLIEGFETKYPDVDVEASYVGTADVISVVPTQVQAGTVADVFLALPGPAGTNVMSVGTLASQNHLLDLSSSSWASEVPETWANDVALDGKTFAYPTAVQSLAAIYNQTKLDELTLSVPETWDEVIPFCEAAAKAGVYAYSQALNDPAGPQMIDLALTATLVYGPDPTFTQQQVDGEATFADSPWRDSVEKYSAMNDAGCFGQGFAGRTRDQGFAEVAAGNALSVVDVGLALPTIQASAPESAFTIAALPATNDASETYYPAAPGYVFVAASKAKNPAAAQAFIDFIAEPENINAFATALSVVPAIPNSSFQAPAELAGFGEAIATGRFVEFPGNDWPNPNVQVVHQDEVEAHLIGQATIDEVLDRMDEAFAGK
ncbi:raffinose/stachyose/melibiose transport system substrate-binding protein [Microbacterium sp. cf046]|uniref:ABC transporter substrate-binding protein n=1 Tax=Microbacterium sp. cf046 TaxID=1761803 RepID=UPI0008E386D8|nr:extracellular solute-binding protein [Microbacterium sp. cf046]SFS16901.1 raffinose/stachyose/melibiose transport system substrate-binding protein [Microbacterium sp. cf046]